MLSGVHAVLYASDPQRARAFFADVLGLGSVDRGLLSHVQVPGLGELGIYQPRHASPRP